MTGSTQASVTEALMCVTLGVSWGVTPIICIWYNSHSEAIYSTDQERHLSYDYYKINYRVMLTKYSHASLNDGDTF